MSELKPLKPELIAKALEKAERYRLLNEPAESESICRDVLVADPNNQRALVWLLLSLTDQIAFGRHGAAHEARNLLARLDSEFEREYYAGVIAERQGKARLRSGQARSGFHAYELLRLAMRHFEEAEAISPPDNDDAVLRYNSCVRMLDAHPELRPEPVDEYEAHMLE
jgi:tetratricopeptide (TPR) repeat protein